MASELGAGHDEQTVEVIDLGGRGPRARSSVTRAAETATSLAIGTVRLGFTAGGALARRLAGSLPGRLAGEVLAGVADAFAAEAGKQWRRAGPRAEEQLERAISVLIPVFIESIDPAELVEQIDVDALLEAVDVNKVVKRVDIDALLAEVDIDALLARIDVAELAKRARVPELVQEATLDVAGGTLDLGRRQVVAVDTLLARAVNRLLGRDPATMPPGPPDLAAAPEEPTA